MLLGAAHVRAHRLISTETAFTLSTCNIAVVLVVDACLRAIVVVKVADGDVLALVLGSVALVWMAQVGRQVRPVGELGDKIKRCMVDHGQSQGAVGRIRESTTNVARWRYIDELNVRAFSQGLALHGSIDGVHFAHLIHDTTFHFDPKGFSLVQCAH